jgi:hypothetical protein
MLECRGAIVLALPSKLGTGENIWPDKSVGVFVRSVGDDEVKFNNAANSWTLALRCSFSPSGSSKHQVLACL